MSNDFEDALGEVSIEQLSAAIYRKLLELEGRLNRIEQKLEPKCLIPSDEKT